jgi:hypothetical protein
MYKTIFVTGVPGNTFPQQGFARIDELVALGQTDGVRSMTQTTDHFTIIRTWIDQASAQGWINWCTINAPNGYPFISLTLEPVTP